MSTHTTHAKIDKLWQQFGDAIDAAYRDGQKLNDGNGHAECNALKDYAGAGTPWKLAGLVGRESANERQHRRGSVPPIGFSVGDAARLHLMDAAAEGALRESKPASHLFLTMRQTAAEAHVIGWLCRKRLAKSWREELATLDYVQLMEVRPRFKGPAQR